MLLNILEKPFSHYFPGRAGCLVFSLGWLLLPGATPVFAQVTDRPSGYVTQINSGDFAHKYEIPPLYLEYLTDPNDSFSLEDLQKGENANRFSPFLPFSGQQPNPEEPFQPFQTYWIKFDLRSNLLKDSEWVLFIGYVSHAEIYTLYENGAFEKHQTGFFVSAARKRPNEGEGIKSDIFLPAQSTTTVYVKFKNDLAYPPEPHIALQADNAWQEYQARTDLVQGIFHGLLWMILLYNLFLYLSTGNRTYLYFLAYIFFISLYFMNEYGYLAKYLFFHTPRLSFYLGNLIYVALVFYILFNRSFLSIPEQYPRLDGFVKFWLAVSVLFLVVAIPLHYYAFDLYQPVRNGFHLFYVLCLVVFIFSVLFIRDMTASLFVLCNFFVLLGGFCIVLGNFGIIDFSLYYLLGGIVAQLLAFTITMSYRYRYSLLERQQAQEELIDQLQENKRLQSRINQELEDKVRERTQEIEQQKEEIETQNEVLVKKSDELELAYNKIQDSVRYAQRLQGAILGDQAEILNDFQDGFIFFLPRDYVSGDFYWSSKIGHQRILIAADCTGHGIPGSLMTMLGNSILNDVVNEEKITEPDQILYALDAKLVKTIQKQSSGDQPKDGMDIVVICLDEISYTLRYAGAKNPLYYVRDFDVQQIKGSPYPIGIYKGKKEKQFPVHEMQVQPGDILYLSTDGFQDQFGGAEDKKYLKKRFRELLLEISHLTMTEQKERLREEFRQWKGENHQTDDVLVIGILI